MSELAANFDPHNFLHDLDDKLFALHQEHGRINSIMRGLKYGSLDYDDHEEHRRNIREAASSVESAMRGLSGFRGPVPFDFSSSSCNAAVNGRQCSRPFKGLAAWNSPED